jgi:hypothetical protein
MGYVCRNCDYFDGTGEHSSACPSCGGDMRFTMLEPRATATATLDGPAPREAWQDTYKFGYEEVEATWGFRYAQIGVGMSVYFFISRLVVPIILIPLALALQNEPPAKIAVVLGVAYLFLYSVAATAGGAVAGFWARNWLPQGLGVAAGVFFVPLIIKLILWPQNWWFFGTCLAFTSVLSVVGAFFGHLFIKPTRIVKS